MKTIRKLTNRQLDKLQDRLGEKYWAELDVAPWQPKDSLVRRLALIQIKLGGERIRRLGL